MMGRPNLSDSSPTERFQMFITADEIAAIDEWRFANRVGNRSEAIRQLCRIGLKAKGPATAPTVPSHGSSIPQKDIEMNEVTNTTAPAATLDISDLENPLADATRMASITSRLIGDCLGGPNKGNKYYLTPTQIEDMLFATYQVEDLIRKIYATWELILTGAGRAKESDPIIAAIAAYRDGIQKYNNVPDNEEDEKNYLWREPWNVLKSWDQPCRSREGAAEAIRLALYEDDIGESQLPAPLMGAALAYLEGASA